MSVFLVIAVVAFVLLLAGVSRVRRGPLDPEKRPVEIYACMVDEEAE